MLAALDRLDSELDGNEYLVGDRFTVADLTAAALFYPLVPPPEGPGSRRPPESFESFREPLRDRPGYRYVEEMFRRHRKPRGRSRLSIYQPSVPGSPLIGPWISAVIQPP